MKNLNITHLKLNEHISENIVNFANFLHFKISRITLVFKIIIIIIPGNYTLCSMWKDYTFLVSIFHSFTPAFINFLESKVFM